MALDHLKESVTKGNLWIYVLSVLRDGESSPNDIKGAVKGRFGFEPATITFYSVLYKLTREGLVRKSSAEFRSKYQITALGVEKLGEAREFLDRVRRNIEP